MINFLLGVSFGLNIAGCLIIYRVYRHFESR